MKAAFLTLGCKLNYAETSTYERLLKAGGFEIAGRGEEADYYIVNTCSVTAVSDAKSRNLVRKVHRLCPSARIAVVGCSAELRRDDFESIEGVWRVFGSAEKQLLVPAILEECGREGAIPAETVFAAYSCGERTRSFLKVQDGCDNFCKYCTVPYARGRSRNVPLCECVRNAREIAATGVKEIVLTGVNTGDYGKTTGESFLDLLKALQEVDGIERYRISSIEPNLLTDEIIGWIASEGSKFQPHFHIPLQTGCDELLGAMGRHYDTAFFASKIESVRRAMEKPGRPKVFFGIDVMVGLPGETPELFAKTVAFLEKIRPSFIHVFPYSRRPGTPAAAMSGQVDEKIKQERVRILEDLCARLHSEFVGANAGLEAEVLFESRDKDGLMSGYTGNYIRVSRPYDDSLVGTIVKITIPEAL